LEIEVLRGDEKRLNLLRIRPQQPEAVADDNS